MFYVYTYKDPRPAKNRQVVYVGKGQGDRFLKHWEKGVNHNLGFSNFLSLLRKMGLAPIIEKVQLFETESDAHESEIALIKLYGRRNLKTGTLFNLTDGGEGMVGAVRTPEWRNAVSEALSTPEHVQRQRANMRAVWDDPVQRKKRTALISAAVASPEVKAIRAAAIEKFVHTDKFKATMSKASKEVWLRDGHKEKTIAAMKSGNATPEAFAKKSAAVAKGWQDESTRAKRVAGIKASRTPELRAQIGASCAALWDEQKKAEQSAKMKAVYATPEAKAAKSAAMKLMWAKRRAAQSCK